MITVPILAIDPGSRCTGISILIGPSAWTMVMRSQTTPEILVFLNHCVDVFGTRLTLVLEDQYIDGHGPSRPGGRQKINWPALLKLVVARVRWQALAESVGIHVVLANTGTWQAKMHATVPKRDPETGKELTRKQRSKRVVSSVWHDIPRITCPADVRRDDLPSRASGLATNDEADSLCIGRWFQLYGEA